MVGAGKIDDGTLGERFKLGPKTSILFKKLRKPLEVGCLIGRYITPCGMSITKIRYAVEHV
jgi:hypothetical protein